MTGDTALICTHLLACSWLALICFTSSHRALRRVLGPALVVYIVFIAAPLVYVEVAA